MRITKAVFAAVATAGLMFCLTAWAAEQKSEAVEQSNLPAAVQKTIKTKAAGGEVVRVQREDDKNGRWNYEVVVKTNGKEWGFEVDPNGRFVKKHADHNKTE